MHANSADGEARRHTHVVWADNIWLLAANARQAQQMLDELGAWMWSELHMVRKPKSLEVLDTESVPLELRTALVARSCPEREKLPVRQVEVMAALGDRLNSTGGHAEAWGNRKAAAERCYHKHRALLEDRALPRLRRLRALSQSAGAACLYCTETWHLCGADLCALRT